MVSSLMFRQAALGISLFSWNCERRDRKRRMEYFVKKEQFFYEG